ncbi:hypothetical protein EST38_g6653 [Candolleomyces aberdarensis]|uniref:Uncharacterized protein n=1 Tax=Candolleomyces aberdarensis TaxID=2316362 RepID=A0A4Q2DJC9_9AGAR|nr:hypothetical protein EST38_g6653 [Candolleomyces aberdarensis]
MPGVTTRSKSKPEQKVGKKTPGNEVAQKRSKLPRHLKKPGGVVEPSSGSSQESSEKDAAPSKSQSASQASEESSAVQPEEEDVATVDLVSATARLVERVSNEAGTLRTEAGKMDQVAEELKRQVQALRTAVQMQTVKRERMEAFVVHWRRVAGKMPYETLWGEKNGRVAMYKRAHAREPVEVTSSDEEGLGLSMKIFV